MLISRAVPKLLLAATLAACATTAKFQQQMDTWVGGDVNQAIMRFGPPSQSYTLPNGSKMYSWLWVGNTVVTANYSQYLNMVTAGATTYWCQIGFTAGSSGRIEAWQARGNACRSR
jgi:hypothetical protein